MEHHKAYLRIWRLMASVLAVCFLYSCFLPPITSFYATKRSEVFFDPHQHMMHSFEARELICFVVEGYDGQTVTVRVINMLTGREIVTNTADIPQGKNQIFMWNLPPGSYTAELSVSGLIAASWKFDVVK